MAKKKRRKKRKKKAPKKTPAQQETPPEPPAVDGEKSPNAVLRKELDANPIVARGPSTPTLAKRQRQPQLERPYDPMELAPRMPGPSQPAEPPAQRQARRRRQIKTRRTLTGKARQQLPRTMRRV